MKFPYLKLPFFDLKLKRIARPYIPIKLTGPEGSWEGYGLIDSGADRSLFNIQIAEKIGLRLTKNISENFGGIEGGIIEGFLHRVNLQVIGMDKEIGLLAGFVSSSGVAAILGQEDFFDNFRIKFERDHGIIEVNPIR